MGILTMINQIDYFQRIKNAQTEIEQLCHRERIMFNSFRHLKPATQDRFIDSLRHLPKLCALLLSIQQDDEMQGWSAK